MKKAVITTVTAMTFLGNILLNNGINVCADETDEQIQAHQGKVADLKAREATALAQLRTAQDELLVTQKRQKDLNSSIQEHHRLSEILEKDIALRAERLIKRREKLNTQARSMQVRKSSRFRMIFHIFTSGGSLSKKVDELNAANKMFKAQDQLLVEQKRDYDAFIVKSEENQRHISELSDKLREAEQVQAVQLEQKARVETTKLELQISRETEEGKVSELVHKKAEIVARAQAVKAQREAAQRQAQVAQQELASHMRATNPSTPSGGGRSYGGSGGGRSTYPSGSCTDYVKGRNSWTPNFLGNACEWGRNAAAQGFVVNSTPAPGAIAVFSPDSYSSVGHVAVVESISGGSVHISEGNYLGRYNERNIPAGKCQYIHPPK